MGFFQLLERFLNWLFGYKGPQASAPPKPIVPKYPSSIPPAKGKATAKKSLTALVGAGAAGILVTFVPQFEGMILRGYKDPIGIVTACAGHTKTAVFGRAYTLEECNTLLDQDLASHAAGTMKCITVPTSVGERAAYVSFAYNVGTGAFCKSTLVRKLNAGDRVGACNELLRWTKAGGKELKGLVRRRQAELELCLKA
jgi:lysozyme